MSENIINLFKKEDEELKYCSYYELDGIGLSMLDKSLILLPLNGNEIELSLGDSSNVYSRKELAEFVKVASVLLDSEDRFLPKLDLIGLNYNDETKA